MRFLAAGFTVLVLASATFAQVRGEVESIGFGSAGLYRPECWTPMVVRLDSQSDDPAEYRIEVHQRDLDFDHVIYVKEGITLNPHSTQRWELCFLPEPTNGGLPDGSLPDLQNRLRVYLTSKDGSKQLLQLPITSSVNSLEMSSGGFSRVKGQKLVLVVAESGNTASSNDYANAIGVVEYPNFVRVQSARQLPQSVLAYQAVDAVLWMHGDARVLSEQGSKQLSSLQQWVRQGGMLVICQPANDGERQLIAPFADMLPIEWQVDGQWKVSNKSKEDLAPLTVLGKWKSKAGPLWTDLRGPFDFARATAKPNAVVDHWIDWDAEGKDQTPYIARIPYGLGSVTWVAQDLGNPKLNRPTAGCWPYVWDAVFGWKNDTHVAGDFGKREQDEYAESFTGPGPLDLGTSQRSGVEFRGRSATLIVVAVFFFIIYWIVAGPGTYLFLVGKKRQQHSWTAFGFTALGATVLTVLIVRLVQRGGPQVKHASNVRIVSGQLSQPAIVYSGIGLYIPRDGLQQVSLDSTSSEYVSYVTPLAIHPSQVPDNEFPANLDYKVPIRDAGMTDAPMIEVPFRSTLKKLQAKWCGDAGLVVRANSVKLDLDRAAKDALTGSIDNLSGTDLKNVYVAFRFDENQDWILYLPYWSGDSGRNRIDIVRAEAEAGRLVGYAQGAQPSEGKACAGDMRLNWTPYWQMRMQGTESIDDIGTAIPVAFPVLSFFDRILPAKNDKPGNEMAFTLLRRGMHNLNMSQALEAGELVVLAEASDRPLPYPLEVNGSKVEGEGTVFYQFALPIERIAPKPTTAPAEPAPAVQSRPAR